MDRETVDTLLEGFDQKELIELISAMTFSSKTAENQLLEFCQKQKPRQNKSMVLEKQLQNAWDAAYEIIDSFNDYGGGPEEEEEEAYDELDEMERLLDEGKISWKVRKEVLDEMLVEIDYDNSGFGDSLITIATKLCQSKEEMLYLADHFSDDVYYTGFAAQIYRNYGEKSKPTMNEKVELHF